MELMQRLGIETLEAHKRTESLPYFRELVAGTLPREAFAASIAQLYFVRARLEQHLIYLARTHLDIAAVLRPWHVYSDLFKTDAERLDCRVDLPDALTQMLLDYFDACAAEEPFLLLGPLYVLEGSNMGSAMLRPQMIRTYGLNRDVDLTSMFPHGKLLRTRWADFGAAMNALSITDTLGIQIVSAASNTFDYLARLYEGLYSDIAEKDMAQ